MRIFLVFALAASGAVAQPASSSLGEPISTERRRANSILAELFESAWTQSRQPTVAAARSAQLDAKVMANRSPFPSPPTLGMEVRRDLPGSVSLPGTSRAAERGQNELEPSVTLPLWLPGQRDAQHKLLEHERAQLDAQRLLERLRLAGQVREAAWSLAQADTQVQLHQARLAGAQALQADVARRVEAGDLAPVDRALAGMDTWAAQAALLEAEARLAAAAVELRKLTGRAMTAGSVSGKLGEHPAPALRLEAHPAMLAARQSVATGHARLALAIRQRRDNPSLSASARFDRDVEGGPYRNTFRIGIALPLDTQARNAPQLAAAAAELTEAEVALERIERELMGDVERARMALASAQDAAQALDRRVAEASWARDAIERAFRAGQRGLHELLRMRALAFEAEMASRIARDQLGLAQARLMQALGIEP